MHNNLFELSKIQLGGRYFATDDPDTVAALVTGTLVVRWKIVSALEDAALRCKSCFQPIIMDYIFLTSFSNLSISLPVYILCYQCSLTLH